MIAREVIDEIVARNDIESVIGSYVTLKRAGSNMKGLCPFHSEKTFSYKRSEQYLTADGKCASFYGQYDIYSNGSETVEYLAGSDLITFTLIGCAPPCLFPTTVVALRAASGSGDPTSVVPLVIICSFSLCVISIVLSRILAGGKR